MEKIVKKKDSTMAVLAVVLLALGGAILGWSLYMLPVQPAYGFPWAFTAAVISFIPLAAAGWCLNAVVGRRKYGTCRYGRSGHDSAAMFGIFAIVAGSMLLCFNAGIIAPIWKPVFFSWQMVLIVAGAIELARGRFVGGIMIIAIGGYFVVGRLAHIYPDASGFSLDIGFWPLLLIMVGIVILVKNVSGEYRYSRPARSYRNGHQKWGAVRSGSSGYVDINTVFGSSEQVYLDPVFRGGKISTVFGGVILDLRRTELPEGETHLRVDSVFGGIEIYAPDGWNIELINDSLFGGFADKRFPAMTKTYSDDRKLVIRSSNLFGGGEIK